MKSKSWEQWKKYFESGNCSIYEIIHHAIRVAALDDPKEFKLRREQIVEKLYSCQFTGCCCADQTELGVQRTIIEVSKDCKNGCARTRLDGNAVDSEIPGGRGSKVGEHGQIMGLNEINKNRNNEAEALADKIDDDYENIRHVIEIKEELENSEEQTEKQIYEALRRLQLMVLSVEVLEVTKIGTTIIDLQQHWSRQINQLAKSIANEWKKMVEESVETAAETAERSKNLEPDTNVLEEWRALPSPSMAEVLFVSQPLMAFTEEFFDGVNVDDEIDPGNGNEIEKIQESQRNPPTSTENKTELKLQLSEGVASIRRQMTKQESIEKLINSKYTRPSNKSYELGKNRENERFPPTQNKRKLELQLIEEASPISTYKRQKGRQESIEKKSSHSANSRPPKSEYASDSCRKPRVVLKQEAENDKKHKNPARQIPKAGPENSRNSSSDETAMEEKLETSKKKLHAGYEAHKRARRDIQHLEFCDVPKQASRRRSLRSNYFRNQSWRWQKGLN